MCYNYNNIVFKKDFGGFISRYKLRPGERYNDWDAFKERFLFYYANGFEHRQLPVITMEEPHHIQFFNWGLIPHWVKSKTEADTISKQTLNARSETIFKLPSFRSGIKTQRCLVLASGFYEWRQVDGKKYPYHIMVKDDEIAAATRPFCMGGIYSTWVDKETAEVIHTFSIITTPANEMMQVIHNSKQRMPLILRREDEQIWLSPGLDEAAISRLMQPYPQELMMAHTIGKLITAPGLNRNVEQLIEPVTYPGLDTWIKGDAEKKQ